MKEYLNKNHKSRFCINGGCSFKKEDLCNMDYFYIKKLLDDGIASICANLNFVKDKDGEVFFDYYLFLKARNWGKGPVDLFSIQRPCAAYSLYTCGIKGFANVSGINFLNRINYFKHSKKEKLDWLNDQYMLEQLVIDYTNNEPLAELKKDICNFFVELEDLDIKDISPYEAKRIDSLMPFLSQYFFNELIEAQAIINANEDKSRVRKIYND